MKPPFSWKQRGAVVLLVVTAAGWAGCRRKETVAVQQTDEEGPRIASIVHTGDPKSEKQLVSGFYGIEENAWRWTASRFSVVLRPPAGAAAKGATLNVQLSVPDPVIAKVKAISLSATIGTTPLSPETYTQPGQYTYTRDVAASLLGNEAVKIDFQTDKSLPPSGGDQRELAVIVGSVGLDAK